MIPPLISTGPSAFLLPFIPITARLSSYFKDPYLCAGIRFGVFLLGSLCSLEVGSPTNNLSSVEVKQLEILWWYIKIYRLIRGSRLRERMSRSMDYYISVDLIEFLSLFCFSAQSIKKHTPSLVLNLWFESVWMLLCRDLSVFPFESCLKYQLCSKGKFFLT